MGIMQGEEAAWLLGQTYPLRTTRRRAGRRGVLAPSPLDRWGEPHCPVTASETEAETDRGWGGLAVGLLTRRTDERSLRIFLLPALDRVRPQCLELRQLVL